MIQKTLKTTRGKLKVAIPSSLEEVTLGQLMELQEKPSINDLEAVSILANLPLSQLQDVISIDDIQQFNEPVLALSEQIKHLYNSDKLPKTITFSIKGQIKKVDVIHNLSMEPAGAFMAARDIISEEISEHIKQYGEEEWQQHYNLR